MVELLPALPEQQFVTQHLPGYLLGLGVSHVVEFAYDGPPFREERTWPPMFPSNPINCRLSPGRFELSTPS